MALLIISDGLMILFSILFWNHSHSFHINNNVQHVSRRTIIDLRSSSLYSSSPNRFAKEKESLSFHRSSNKKISKKNSPPPPLSAERTVVIMYHKPKNIVTSHLDKHKTTVYEDIMSMRGYISPNTKLHYNILKQDISSFTCETRIQSKLHAIGRLDADTSGLLLLTNDGLLVHAVTNPNAHISFPITSQIPRSKLEPTPKLNTTPISNHLSILSEKISKTYLVRVMGYHTHPEDECIIPLNNNVTSSSSMGIAKLLQGIAIPSEAETLQPVSNISILSHDPMFYPNITQGNINSTLSKLTRRVGTCTWLHITLYQGKNRQIRNMFHAIGSGVLFLHRISIGNIYLSDPSQQKRKDGNSVEYALQPGEWRVLTEEEVWNGLGYPSRTLPT